MSITQVTQQEVDLILRAYDRQELARKYILASNDCLEAEREVRRLRQELSQCKKPEEPKKTWVTVYDKGLGYHKECPACGARWMLDSQEHVCKETPFCHNCGEKLEKEETYG